MVLNPIKIFKGSFGGPTLFQNPKYISPNEVWLNWINWYTLLINKGKNDASVLLKTAWFVDKASPEEEIWWQVLWENYCQEVLGNEKVHWNICYRSNRWCFQNWRCVMFYVNTCNLTTRGGWCLLLLPDILNQLSLGMF